ncbi:hypothetical protein BDR05DRAFT_963048 [Suillus weaverae]|nr:hypothetical protein BDR05DRAFT_963048 [Suillus weaverae]
MVAAYRFDLLAAASVGSKIIYAPWPPGDLREVRDSLSSKKDGDEVDLVVQGYQELARLVL